MRTHTHTIGHVAVLVFKASGEFFSLWMCAFVVVSHVDTVILVIKICDGPLRAPLSHDNCRGVSMGGCCRGLQWQADTSNSSVVTASAIVTAAACSCRVVSNTDAPGVTVTYVFARGGVALNR